ANAPASPTSAPLSPPISTCRQSGPVVLSPTLSRGSRVMDAWVQAMRRGDFPTAWRISDGVLKHRLRKGEVCDSWPRNLQFIWRGEPLAGRRLFVRCYHGLGDTLQFVRLLATPRLRAAEITLWAQPQLLTLLRTVRGIDHLLPLHEGEPDVDYD